MLELQFTSNDGFSRGRMRLFPGEGSVLGKHGRTQQNTQLLRNPTSARSFCAGSLCPGGCDGIPRRLLSLAELQQGLTILLSNPARPSYRHLRNVKASNRLRLLDEVTLA